MRRCPLGIAALVFLSSLVWGVGVRAQSGIEIDCEATLQSLALSHPNLHCSCPCATCSPDCSESGAAPWSSGHASHATSSEMFAAQMLGEMLGQILASAFAEPKQDPAALEAQRQAEEAARKAWEEQQQKLRDEWKAKQAQAAKDSQRAQTQAQQQGQALLSQMQGMEGVGGAGQPLQMQSLGGSVEGFKWDTPGPAAAFKPMGSGRFDTSGLKSWQRLLCATYFSQSALSVAPRDPEQARFFEEQATKVSAGEAVELPCSFPAMPAVPEPPKADASMARTVQALETVRVKVKELQEVDTHLQKLRSEKTDVHAKVQKAEAAKIQAEAAKAQAKPEDAALMAEILRRLNEAQCQLDDANKKLVAMADQEQELLQQKEMIRLDLQQIQQQVQGAPSPKP